MHIVIINGPKYTGKDTLGAMLLKLFPGSVMARFKDVLYEYSFEHWDLEKRGMTLESWIELCNDPNKKELPVDWLMNGRKKLSPRQALIHVSEDIIKVEYGEDGVSFLTTMRLKDKYPDYDNMMFIFTDGGFNVEINALIRDFGITRKHMTVLRIDRKGCSYVGDSREYIKNPDVMLTNRENDPSYYLIQAKTEMKYRALDNRTIPIQPLDRLSISQLSKEVKLFNPRN